MKKIVLIASALLMVVSGVAAVSAYEAHTVNVTAHVENALETPTALIIGGSAAFPEEWLVGTIDIAASTSFKNQSPLRVTDITYKVCATPKTIDVPGMPLGHKYVWAGGFTFVSSDYDPADPPSATWTWIGPTADENPPTGTPAIVCPTGFTGTVTNAVDGELTVGMDMPVFTDYVNSTTDVDDKPRPANADGDANGGCPDRDADGSYTDDPCVISTGVFNGEDFGLDIIIQVTNIQ